MTPPSPSGPLTGPLTVRVISESEHLDFVRSRRSASFLQTPAWGAVKSEWRRESLGWFRDGEVVGAALVLYRQLPKVKRYLAYLPEGPVIDWETDELAAWLAPMTAHLKAQGAFGVRMGPPVITRRWSAAQVKAGIADDGVRRLGDVPPLERNHTGARVVSQLHELGWKHQTAEGGFAAGQPQYNFVIPLRDDDGNPRTEDDVLKGMNQQWRRNIKKATKEGVEVTAGTGEDLKLFHDLYVHTAERDHFTPRGLAYFRTMHDALTAEDPARFRLWLARHDGRPRRRHDLDPGRRPRLVLLRRLVDREARRPRVQRDPVGDDPGRPARRGRRLRPARHHRHPRRRRPPRRPDPVQGRHRRRGRRVRRRVGPPAATPALQGLRPLHEAPRITRPLASLTPPQAR